MPEHVILVNGLPGSGKTTLSAPLGDLLGATVLSKDRIKEELRTPWGALAMEMVWAEAAGTAGIVITDSWWWRPRDLDHARRGLRRLSYESATELWCSASAACTTAAAGAAHRRAVHGAGSPVGPSTWKPARSDHVIASLPQTQTQGPWYETLRLRLSWTGSCLRADIAPEQPLPGVLQGLT